RGLADDFLARHPEMSLGHPIDQHVTAVAQVLDGDLRRYVIDDLAQEGVIAVAFFFEIPALGDVLDRRHPSASRQRLVDDLDRSSVRGLQGADVELALRNVPPDVRTEFIDIALEGSGVLAMLDQVAEMATRLRDLGR